MWQQRGGTLASAGAVSGAFLLVVLLEAIFLGESKQIVAYIERTEPDVWVMQQGVSNMHMATSFVWDWKVDRIAELPGVETVSPILYANTIVRAGGRDWFAYVVGLPPESTRAGPWAMAAGKSSPEPGEIVIPELLSRASGVALGDTVSIADADFRVAGFSKGTFSMANSIAFVPFSDLEDILSATGTVSYVLVDASAGQNPRALAERIEAEIDKVSALSQEDFVANDFEMAMMMGVEIIAFMTAIGSILAAVIIAFTAFAQISRRRHELAVAKALGVPNRSIYATAITQTVFTTALAYLLAMVAATGAIPLIARLMPEVSFLVSPVSLVRLGAIAVGVALVAALLPAHLIAKVDPASAFKA